MHLIKLPPKQPGLEFEVIDNDVLLANAQRLFNESYNTIFQKSGYAYLKVTDDYIHELYPMLTEQNSMPPAYFDPIRGIGAHITLVNEEELSRGQVLNGIARRYSFHVSGLYKIKTAKKHYIVLFINSPEIDDFRKINHLNEFLMTKKMLIPFHITIATSMPID